MNIKKSGWDFLGWREDNQANNNVLSEKIVKNQNIELQDSKTVHAIWKIQLFPNNIAFSTNGTNKNPGSLTCTTTKISRSNCTGSNCDVYIRSNIDVTNYHKVYFNYKLSSYVGLKDDYFCMFPASAKNLRNNAGTYTDSEDISNKTGIQSVGFGIIYWNFDIISIWME